MAENETPEVTPEPTNQPTPASTSEPVPPAVALWQVVKDATSAQGLAVRELVTEQLINAEIIKRKDAVLVLLTKYEERTKELKKQEKALAKLEFDALGQETRKYYDAEGTKALKAIRDEIAAISQALSNFFDKNDATKLYELAKK